LPRDKGGHRSQQGQDRNHQRDLFQFIHLILLAKQRSTCELGFSLGWMAPGYRERSDGLPNTGPSFRVRNEKGSSPEPIRKKPKTRVSASRGQLSKTGKPGINGTFGGQTNGTVRMGDPAAGRA
jgi:hypothetical protein